MIFEVYKSRHKLGFIGLKIKAALNLPYIFYQKPNVCAVTNVICNLLKESVIASFAIFVFSLLTD